MRSPDMLAQLRANFERYEQMLAEVETGLSEDIKEIDGFGESQPARSYAALLKETAERLRRDRETIAEGSRFLADLRRRYDEVDMEILAQMKNFR